MMLPPIYFFLGKNKKYCFRASFTISIGFILLFSLFNFLGYWQLCRYQEKLQLLNPYEPQTITGQFINNPTLLIDNKLYNNHPGYTVFSPFLNNKNRIILIARGWIAQPEHSRHIMPQVNHLPINTPLILTGQPHTTTHNRWIKNQVEKLSPNLLRVQELDNKLISDYFSYPIENYYFNLSPPSPYLHTLLPEINTWLKPERHKGYALQWFLFAGILLGLYVKLNIKKHSTKNLANNLASQL